MDSSTAIHIENVNKYYKVYNDKSHELKEYLLFWKRNRYEKREVFKNLSLEVKRGCVLGIVGENGSGKSTALKLMSRIIYPNSGRIVMNGRVSSLIELGAGFHPDMSGRENIFINASIFGLTRKEIKSRLQDIIAFSELEEYIDNPVRTYSSGMYMRLAFSVAINVDADILLVDEILAVGDGAFQKKCFEKMRHIKENGTTIVVVSHDLNQIEQICDKCIWIGNGEILSQGETGRVVYEYKNYLDSKERQI
ncbi:MAG: ABC transporter ATP-binding protein [Lachnospira sp.]